MMSSKNSNDSHKELHTERPVGVAETLLEDEFLSAPKFDDSSLKDPIFSILFVLNALVVLALAFSLGASALKFVGFKFIDLDDSSQNIYPNNETMKLVGGIFLTLLVGGFLSMGWIHLLSRTASQIVNFTFGVVVVVTIVSGLSMIFSGMLVFGISLLIIAAFAAAFFKLLQPRLIFASVNLKIACEAIKAMPSAILAAAAVLVVQLIFCFFWMMAALGVATNDAAPAGASCSTYQYSKVMRGIFRMFLFIRCCEDYM
jgi:Plasma-membrane choline transporter